MMPAGIPSKRFRRERTSQRRKGEEPKLTNISLKRIMRILVKRVMNQERPRGRLHCTIGRDGNIDFFLRGKKVYRLKYEGEKIRVYQPQTFTIFYSTKQLPEAEPLFTEQPNSGKTHYWYIERRIEDRRKREGTIEDREQH
jgi:hypothetical protein